VSLPGGGSSPAPRSALKGGHVTRGGVQKLRAPRRFEAPGSAPRALPPPPPITSADPLTQAYVRRGCAASTDPMVVCVSARAAARWPIPPPLPLRAFERRFSSNLWRKRVPGRHAAAHEDDAPEKEFYTIAAPQVRTLSRRNPVVKRAERAHQSARPRPFPPQREQEATVEAKKSRFLARAWRVDSADQAMGYIKEWRDLSVSHNCFAWVVGADARCSDDGEPSGTAGRPILAAIEGEGLSNTAVMVTRYYGGTKLGTGGLVRAYGDAARAALRAAEKVRVTETVPVAMRAPFDQLGAVHRALGQCGLEGSQQEEFLEDGVSVTVDVESARLAALRDAVRDLTRGKVEVVTGGVEGEAEGGGGDGGGDVFAEFAEFGDLEAEGFMDELFSEGDGGKGG